MQVLRRERVDVLTRDARLLTDEDGPAAVVDNPGGRSDIVLVCEHAANAVPEILGRLGLDEAVLASHAGIDIGALAVSRHLARLLDATLVHQRFSRLVYDCNRPPEAADAIPVRSELYAIDANTGLGPVERKMRIDAVYRPFHAAVERVLDTKAKAGRKPVLVTIHTFTRIYFGVRRTVDLGVLHDDDRRLADRLLSIAARECAGFSVSRNAPYGPVDGVTHTLKLHAESRGIDNVMIEIANDLVRTDADQRAWAARLSTLLREATGQVPQSTGIPTPHETAAHQHKTEWEHVNQAFGSQLPKS